MTKVTKTKPCEDIEEKLKRPPIPEHTRFELWNKAGGRCEFCGCNEPLWQDGLTSSKINRSNIAHIISWTPNGPRGDKILSPKLATDISNLMLTCQKHNKLIDSFEYVDEYPVERLLQMKFEHEKRIEVATNIIPENQSTILAYSANVANNGIVLSDKEIRAALLPNYYPQNDEKISINGCWHDHEEIFWSIEKENLEREFLNKVKPKLENTSIKHLSVFSFAPQPLLIYLGYLLTDKYPMEIYQLHRNPASWIWPENNYEEVEFIINRPQEVSEIPVLTISLSATITKDRVVNTLGKNISHWEITIKHPSREFLRNKKTLYMFSKIISELFDEIKIQHGQNTTLHIFPAMPISTAIELGRRIDIKSSMPIKIYDHNNKIGGFAPAIDICLPNNN